MEQVNVTMTAEELAQYEAFRKAQEAKAEEQRRLAQREAYKQMVDDEIDHTIPVLLALSGDIRSAKRQVMDNFKTILALKSEIYGAKVDNLKSHTFTNSRGDMRITLGTYQNDGYRDTVEDGIALVREYLESLAKDETTQALVNMIFKLLSRDAKGTLKASRIVQLRKLANESGDKKFLEGVKIIEDSYQPETSKMFIRADIKGEDNEWKCVPLGMTES